jgi:signal peptidase I
MFIKRVIALPGETIEIRDKRVSIDGEPIDDPWATHSDDRTYSDSRFYPEMVRRRDQFGPLVVPDGTVFLLGDNRDNSNDSRYHGPIDRSLLVSRPLYLYWSSDSSRIGRSLSRE